jgi:adenylate cyclase
VPRLRRPTIALLGSWKRLASTACERWRQRGVARRASSPLLLGALTALVGALIGILPFAAHLEETGGLGLLFRLRGVREPPPDVVVASIDRDSALRLGLSGDPARWPRSIHARLVDTLTQHGAAIIAFDMLFDDDRSPDEDRILADALRRSRNVVLAEYLVRETVPATPETGAPAAHLSLERRVPPVPALARAAVALAPFPLPKIPVRVSQYWTFKAGAGDQPTLPVVALHVFALDAHAPFVELLEQVSPEQARGLPRDRDRIAASGHAEELVRQLREVFLQEPRAEPAMREALRRLPAGPADARHRRMLTALLGLYAGPASHYLNFYGPPRTITTIPYHRLVARAREGAAATVDLDLRGKAVFVGASERLQPHQRDGFYTVFSQSSGLDLSGVEIAATAFANLLEGLPLRPLPLAREIGFVLAWGFGIGALARWLPTPIGLPVVLGASLAYLLAAAHQFGSAARWYPIVIPLAVQVPLAVLGATAWRYLETHRERHAVRRALGYYLPAAAVDEVLSHLGDLRSGRQLVYGTCLSTDAHQYTALSETMDPATLAEFMNRYYAAVFEPVKRHGGVVQDVVGDSMLAVWATAQPDAGPRTRACLAALDIARAVDRFDAGSGALSLLTRIGLHSGQVLLGNIGAGDHFEYRAVGDIVNTATRLEGLNKLLGTRILVSRDVIHELGDFFSRELGAFVLAGKSRPVEVHELLCRRADITPRLHGLVAAFGRALTAYRDQAWKEASELFQECADAHGEDGPSRFYAQRCEVHAEQPPPQPWDAVVRLDSK